MGSMIPRKLSLTEALEIFRDLDDNLQRVICEYLYIEEALLLVPRSSSAKWCRKLLMWGVPYYRYEDFYDTDKKPCDRVVECYEQIFDKYPVDRLTCLSSILKRDRGNDFFFNNLNNVYLYNKIFQIYREGEQFLSRPECHCYDKELYDRLFEQFTESKENPRYNEDIKDIEDMEVYNTLYGEIIYTEDLSFQQFIRMKIRENLRKYDHNDLFF